MMILIKELTTKIKDLRLHSVLIKFIPDHSFINNREECKSALFNNYADPHSVWTVFTLSVDKNLDFGPLST